jgi:alpha-N-arabinofuranosidase
VGEEIALSEQGRHRVEVHLHTEHRIAPVDERIFGGFLEHMGRAVYEGVFDPDSALSDDRGFRLDVLEALKRLRMPVVRYPGGNFVSNHRWRDGIGPRHERPRRPDFAWRSVETHQFGTDEFMAWCDALGTRPMLAVNLGTAGPAEAAELVEYCNLPAGTSIADERVANGHRDPYGVTLWCLGNEMDGPWQAGHVPAPTYAERALAASSLMKGLDPTIETIVCGSSHRALPTYLLWDRTVLEHCWDRIDYLSAHRYSRNDRGDTAAFLAEGVVVDEILTQYRGLLDYVRAIKRSDHRVHISFDEWNVWYREMGVDGGWLEAPHLLEEVYNLEDALVCAQYLHAFIRHSDIVKIACLAQIVNVIAPVLTRADGLLVQSIYWPFLLLREAVVGDALRVAVRAPEVPTRRGDVPVVDAAATFDGTSGAGCISLVHRDPDRGADVLVRVADRSVTVTGARLLHAHPKAHNDWGDPNAVTLRSVEPIAGDDGALHVTLPAPSHLVVTFSTDSPEHAGVV